jgi:hypothetical protein
VSTPEATTEDGGTRLVCTVTTVLDTLANVEAFVQRNLASGVDHMFVFLDDADPDIHAHFTAHPHVTTVLCDDRYWLGERPASLNARQTHNSNLVNVLLSPFGSVRWLFHIDGDECLDIDRAELLALDDDVRAVHLPPWEAVSRAHWPGPVDRFKRPLDEAELSLLTVLDVIPVATMRGYFNGHVLGKRGIRPDLDVRLALHTARDHRGNEIAAHTDHTFRVLHYESYSGEEFVRKWTAHLSSARTSKFSAKRDRLRLAIQAVLANTALDQAAKQELLMEIHERLVQDDVETLERLGYLVSTPAERHRGSPDRFPPGEAEHVAALLSHLETAEPRRFTLPGTQLDPRVLLWDARQHLAPDDAGLATRLDALLDRSRPRPG